MMGSEYIYTIPTKWDSQKTIEEVSRYDDWFYRFKFTNGVVTDLKEDLINTIHETRAEIVFPFLDEMFKDRWNETTCVDIACNQGWFSTQIALRGAKEVEAFDIRQEHLDMANAIKDIGGLKNISYSKQNLFELDRSEVKKYDLTLFLGLLYHLENPMGALRKVKELTGNICVIETQVARTSPNLEILNGSDTNTKRGCGIGVFNSDENHVQNGLSVVIVPTLDALYKMLYAAGFKRLYLAVPPSNMYQQYPDFDRVIIFAQV